MKFLIDTSLLIFKKDTLIKSMIFLSQKFLNVHFEAEILDFFSVRQSSKFQCYSLTWNGKQYQTDRCKSMYLIRGCQIRLPSGLFSGDPFNCEMFQSNPFNREMRLPASRVYSVTATTIEFQSMICIFLVLFCCL